MKIVLTDTDRLDWCIKHGRVPIESEQYWGSTLWFIPDIPRVKATTFCAALNDAIRKANITEYRNAKQKKKYSRQMAI